MLIFVKLLAPVLIGGTMAGATMFTLVQTQTRTPAPEDNPASQQIITYGD